MLWWSRDDVEQGEEDLWGFSGNLSRRLIGFIWVWLGPLWLSIAWFNNMWRGLSPVGWCIDT
jgi:hypothetical protein